jgi:enoyl-CoA hydratase/carnithine racemase
MKNKLANKANIVNKNIIVTIDNKIAEITLNRPERMNAITVDLLKELKNELITLNSNSNISVIILTGAGKAFSAGVDLRQLETNGIDVSSGGVGKELDKHANTVIKLIEESSKAIVSKINGYCFTGGLELALSADLIYIANEAKLGDTHAILGFRPSWGLTQRLPRYIGTMRAKELSFTAKTITGIQAKEYGIALESFPLEDLNTKVKEIAENIAQNSPNSIKAYKDLYSAARNKGQIEGLAYEANTTYDIPEVNERIKEFLKKLR